jgi:hypothetical protein
MTMRFNNPLTVKASVGEISPKLKENCDNSSEISDSMESVIETNNNSTMNDNFSWNISKQPTLELAKISKSFTVLCAPESENYENHDYKQTPSSR